MLIIGAGHAGISAAEELRRINKKGDILIVDSDPDAFYYRASMKFFLKGEMGRDNLVGRTEKYLKKQKITILKQRVVKLLPAEKKVQLDDGTEVYYTKLLIATGSNPFMPPVPGIDLPGVYPMRTLEDTEKIKEVVKSNPGQTFTVVGAGVLGLELAECLVKFDAKINLISDTDYLAPKLFDRGCAQLMATIFEAHGVKIHHQQLVASIEAKNGGVLIRTKSGLEIPSKAAFFTTGVRSDVALARDAGITIGKGIRVKSTMETSIKDIYAAGDCVELPEGSSIQLWAPAGQMGLIAARNMRDQASTFDIGCVHSYTVLFEKVYHALGDYEPEQGTTGYEVIFRESKPNDYFKLVLKDQKLVGVVAYGEIHDPIVLKHVIEIGKPIDPAFKSQIVNPTFDYELLL